MMVNFKKEDYKEDYKVINNLSCLAIDMIDNANSGHPGICLDAATMLYTLYSRHLSFKRDNCNWYNRDRFVLSAGHAAPLLYATLYMLDILSWDDIHNFRQINSNTPSFPTVGTPGVDMSSGPLGQGIASAVGMAISERYLNATYSKELIDHYTYVLAGDGDLMEGISYEALSIASKLKLNKLIILYDSNDVTLDGNLSNCSNEDIITRFKSLDFNIFVVNNNKIKDIDIALTKAKNSNRPNIIIIKTIIGEHSLNAGTNIVHGKPLEKNDITQLKNALGVYDSPFCVSSESIKYFQNKVDTRMHLVYKNWQRKYNNLKESKSKKLDVILNGINTFDLNDISINYQDLYLKDISHNILNEISNISDLVIGGSADVSSSCKTNLDKYPAFDSNNYKGRNINFGVREHAMAGIANGIALSNLRPFCSTFLVFSDYLKPSIRMSALMNCAVLYIFTHDSITIGEDGKTHQPIEQLYSLELIPNLFIYRPYDVNELISCYKEIYSLSRPSCLILPKENNKVSELTKGNIIENGAYILKKEQSDNYIILLANGEEVGLIIELEERLKSISYDIRLVSIPCYKNFSLKDKNFQEKILPKDKTIIAITYGVSDYYYRFTNNVIGLNEFGASGKVDDVLEHFNLNIDKLEERIIEICGKK